MYYFTYPAINLTSFSFWIYVFGILVVFSLLNASSILSFSLDSLFSRKKRKNFHSIYILLIIPVALICILVVNFLLSPVFHSKSYYKRITVEVGDFSQDILEVDFNKLPLLDRDSSEKIGDRTMGQLSELVSQFDVSEQYTQINYQDEIVRVTPLEYNGFVKWFTNRRRGIKGYITVNSTTGSSQLVKLDKGLKYAPSAYFNENLYRILQFQYPTYNFDSINFEIDNDGNPYWIASVVRYIGVGLKREVKGIVIFDPISGDSRYYKVSEVPLWVDHVYEADLILEQVHDWGLYKNGYFNSLIGQKEVVATTEGYNYLAQNDDIYLYTGITSVVNDESNIGFILTNLRTKKTIYYSVAGAEEYSAMDSAKGQVQQMNYTSTFPLLINLHGRPTYLVSLKDNAGLVKMYGFVDVVDYQKVVVTDSSKGILEAADLYLAEVDEEEASHGNYEKDITVHNLSSAILNGNTFYYFEDDDGQKYKVSIQTQKDYLPFLKEGSSIHIVYRTQSEVITITEIHW